MFVLNLVKVECFKDCLDIFCLIKEYLGIISYLNNFYCNDFCFFVHIQFMKVIYKVIDKVIDKVSKFLCIFQTFLLRI